MKECDGETCTKFDPAVFCCRTWGRSDQNADTLATKSQDGGNCGDPRCWCADESAPDSLTNSQKEDPRLPATKRAELLEEAKAVVSGPRAANYGPPEDNFRRIANLWTEYIHERNIGDEGVEPHDVAAMMILMKVARIIEDPSHKDSWTDTAGYAACGYSVAPPS